jgi:hypothetical protein
MEPLWQLWKQGFDTWEQSTAKLFETWLKSPLVLEPAGKVLSVAMKLKKQADDALQQAWANAGLPTRREQERMLHVLNQLQSRLIDLEDKLEDALDTRAEKPEGR